MWQRLVLVTCHADRACTNGMSQCNHLRHTISVSAQKGCILCIVTTETTKLALLSRYIHRAGNRSSDARAQPKAPHTAPQRRPIPYRIRYDLRRQDLARSGLPPAAYGNRDDALLGNAERYEPSTVMRRNPTGTIRRKPCENARPVLRSELKLRAQRHQARLTQQGPSRAGVRVGHALCQCTRCAPCITKLQCGAPTTWSVALAVSLNPRPEPIGLVPGHWRDCHTNRDRQRGKYVISAKAGTQRWVPAFAEMTVG